MMVRSRLADLPPAEPGVYVKVNGAWKEMLPERAEFRSSFLLPVTRTGSVTKSRLFAKVPEAESKLRLNLAAEFAIVCAGETTATDYALLRADANKDAKSDHRQYRVEFITAAGTLTSVGGTSKNNVAFEASRAASRTYLLKLPPIEKGEYGFLPPSAITGTRAGSLGKIHSFGID